MSSYCRWCQYICLFNTCLNQSMSLHFNFTINENNTHTHTHISCVCICLLEHRPTCQCGVMVLTVGRGSFITIKITPSKRVCFGVRVKRNHAGVSYHCTIGNMNTQQEAEPKLQVWVSDDFGELKRVRFDLHGFVPLHLKSPRLHAGTTVSAVQKSAVSQQKKKSLNCEAVRLNT